MIELRPTPSAEDVQTSSGFPHLSGVSLKPCHYQAIVAEKPLVGFFEIHAENYLSAGGPSRYYLEKIREHYPITVHGVGLSIGGESPLNREHLKKVAQLVEWIEPLVFSEHLAWSSHFNHFFNDLLPLPYTEKTLRQVCAHIDQIQELLKRPMLLENPSTYLRFKTTTMTELEFITAIIERTGCQLLLDVNNVAVSCFNHQQDPYQYIDQFPGQAVRQIHLAGYAVDHNETIPLRIDSHDRAVTEDVWQLYQYTLQQWGDKPTLIEWDGQLPEFAELQQQAAMADQIRTRIQRHFQSESGADHATAISQSILMQSDDVLPQIDAASTAEKQARFAVYRNNVYHSLTEALAEIYPVCKQVVGEDFFTMLARHFIQRHPPTSPVLSEYGADFAEFSGSIPQLSSLPYFAELARLEYQLLQLTHAADMPVLSVTDIQQHLAECADPTQSVWQLAESCLLWQPSCAVGQIYQAHQPDSTLMIQDIQWDKSEYLLLTKREHYGVFYSLSADEYHLLQRLQQGATLEQASQNIAPEHFPELFSTLLQKPIIRAILPQ